MNEPTLSRRSIAKGAAWAVPSIAISTAAPAFAASGTPRYTLRSSWFSRYGTSGYGSCTYWDGYQYQYGYTVNSLYFTLNYDNPSTSDPKGFGVINQASSSGTISPSTSVTNLKYSITVAYPVGMINTSGGAGTYFSFSNSTAGTYWSQPVYGGRFTDSYGYVYDMFTFTWKGTTSGTSKNTTESAYFSPNTLLLDGYWNVANSCIAGGTQDYWIKPTWSFTAGGTLYQSTGKWFDTYMDQSV